MTKRIRKETQLRVLNDSLAQALLNAASIMCADLHVAWMGISGVCSSSLRNYTFNQGAIKPCTSSQRFRDIFMTSSRAMRKDGCFCRVDLPAASEHLTSSPGKGKRLPELESDFIVYASLSRTTPCLAFVGLLDGTCQVSPNECARTRALLSFHCQRH